ncbi:hypothetical protein Tco_0998903, partial [Tanacetum coccineum]
MPLTFQPHSPKERPGLGIMKHTNLDTQESSSKNVLGIVTVTETKLITPSVPTEILKAKAKPFPLCTHYGFNDHRPDDYRNYSECEICGSYNHFTSRHNRVIQIIGGVLAESSQSSESLIGVKCDTCGSTVHSTTNHNEFDHFRRGEKILARKAKEPTKSECLRSMTGVKSYLHKYVEQLGPK